MVKRWFVAKHRALLHVSHTKIIIIFGSPLKKEAQRLDLIVSQIQFNLSFFWINVLQWTNKHVACREQTLFSVLIVSPLNKPVRAQRLKVISVPHILIEKLLQNSCIHASSSVSFHLYMAIEPGNWQQKRVWHELRWFLSKRA